LSRTPNERRMASGPGSSGESQLDGLGVNTVKLEDSIDETITRICDEYARALERYDSISDGKLPPEALIVSSVLMSLGDVITMTMETKAADLWNYNQDALARRNNRSSILLQQPDEYRSKFEARRVDLIIYHGDHTNKSTMDIFCMAEFKKNNVDAGEIERICRWLQFLNACRYGAIITAVETPKNDQYLNDHKNIALAAGRRPILGRIARPLNSGQSWQTYAEIIDNHNYLH
jgi:hypothetical protein